MKIVLFVVYVLWGLCCSLVFYSHFFSLRSWKADLVVSFLHQHIFICLAFMALFILLKHAVPLCLTGAIIIFVMASVSTQVQKGRYSPSENHLQLSVMQFNLFAHKNQIDSFYQYFKNQPNPAPDMIFLQEVSPAFSRGLLSLSKTYPYHTSYKDMIKSGLAVFSKLPLRTHQVLRTHEEGHYYLRVSGAIKGSRFVAYNVHFFSPKSHDRWMNRNDALLSLALKIRKEATENSFMVGDFNTAITSPWLAKAITKAEGEIAPSPSMFFYSWSWFSKKSWLNGVLIDHLLTRPGMTCSKREVVGDFGSDHLPIVNYLQFKR